MSQLVRKTDVVGLRGCNGCRRTRDYSNSLAPPGLCMGLCVAGPQYAGYNTHHSGPGSMGSTCYDPGTEGAVFGDPVSGPAFLEASCNWAFPLCFLAI